MMLIIGRFAADCRFRLYRQCIRESNESGSTKVSGPAYHGAETATTGRKIAVTAPVADAICGGQIAGANEWVSSRNGRCKYIKCTIEFIGNLKEKIEQESRSCLRLIDREITCFPQCFQGCKFITQKHPVETIISTGIRYCRTPLPVRRANERTLLLVNLLQAKNNSNHKEEVKSSSNEDRDIDVFKKRTGLTYDII
ncbi:hypothetical protein APICC_05860 [Apis cerana cerana]|uniref:Uncharacterized protein n=1 Tax=Apis cerana cerana TaxID=94128 RepID=A0A2A3ESH9_APICC|nr:hypothetical protein APICC_05860 [Apis cerana cerana]